MTSELDVDGARAAAVLRPNSADEMAALLREAAAGGKAVIPIGGGRALGMGDPPERFDLGFDTAGLDRVLEHSQADLTCTVEAGVTLEALDETLRRAGQFLPLDPLASPGHTVGGALAAGWTGPLRLGYGSAREFVVGLRVALPNGHLVRSGGKVVKNVSGYDLNKLHLGALGSLGVIVEASFKVYPLPLHTVVVGTEADSVQTAWSEAARVLALPMRPVALTLQAASGSRWLLQARFGGSGEAVRRMAHEAGWPEVEEPELPSSGTWSRIAVPPARLPEVLAAVPDSDRWVALPGTGIAHWFDAADAPVVSRVRQIAEAVGGSLVLMAAPPDLKRAVGAWGRAPVTLPLMRRLRDAFDPGRTLSPGRYVVA